MQALTARGALSDDEIESIFSVLYIPRIARGRRRERREEARKRANVDKALLLSMIGAGMRGAEAAELTWDRVQPRSKGGGKDLFAV